MPTYAHPEVLVATSWVAEHLHDPKLRLVEVDVDTSAYSQGHIPGARTLGKRPRTWYRFQLLAYSASATEG